MVSLLFGDFASREVKVRLDLHPIKISIKTENSYIVNLNLLKEFF